MLVGACVLSTLFLAIVIMTEEVAGDGAHLSRAALVVAVAAFLGYLGTAWIVRRELFSDG